jgi:hypothetical protein
MFNTGFNPFAAPAQTQMPAPQQGANPFGGQPASPFAPPAQYQQPAAPAVSFANLGQGMGDAEEQGERLPPLPLGGHEEFEINAIEIAPSRKPGQQHVIWFRGTNTIVKSKTVPAGTRFLFQAKLTGHNFDSGKADDYARIRAYLASAFGASGDSPEVKANFNNDQKRAEIFAACVQGAFNGKRGAVTNVTHRADKKNPGKFYGSYSFGPLGAAVSPPGPAPTPAPAAGPSNPVSFPPQGWTSLGNGYYVGNVGGQQFTVSENDLRTAQAAGKV